MTVEGRLYCKKHEEQGIRSQWSNLMANINGILYGWPVVIGAGDLRTRDQKEPSPNTLVTFLHTYRHCAEVSHSKLLANNVLELLGHRDAVEKKVLEEPPLVGECNTC